MAMLLCVVGTLKREVSMIVERVVRCQAPLYCCGSLSLDQRVVRVTSDVCTTSSRAIQEDSTNYRIELRKRRIHLVLTAYLGAAPLH